METTKEVLQGKVSASAAVLYMAQELSGTKWKLALSAGGIKVRHHVIEAGDQAQLLELIEKAKERFGLVGAVKVVSCYAARRDGFWLHRWLSEAGIENVVVDSASIDVKRRQRRAKTDRLDALKLLSMLIRHCQGEPDVWQVLRVPSRERRGCAALAP